MSESNSENKSANGNGSTNPNNASSQVSQQGLSEMDDLKAQLEKAKNDFLYLRAEFDNYRRNVIKERADLVKYGSERLIVDVLGVLDNFERALEMKPTPENLANYTKGIEMTQSELRSVLQKFGVTEIPSQGQPFDPNVHEALSSEESTTIKPGFVSRVFKKPYKLHDRVIRQDKLSSQKNLFRID